MINAVLIGLRPYYTQGRIIICVVVLPSLCIGGVLNDLPVFSDDGEIHKGRRNYLYSRSPLSEQNIIIRHKQYTCRGDSQERSYLVVTLVLPSLNRRLFFLFSLFNFMSGRFTWSTFLVTLVLPPMNRNSCAFNDPNFNTFFDAFY